MLPVLCRKQDCGQSDAIVLRGGLANLFRKQAGTCSVDPRLSDHSHRAIQSKMFAKLADFSFWIPSSNKLQLDTWYGWSYFLGPARR